MPISRWLLNLPGPAALHSFVHSTLAIGSPPQYYSHRLLPDTLLDNRTFGIRVLSNNLWHDWPRFRNLQGRMAVFANLVEKERADIVLVQEVARTPFFKADEWLSERLGMAYVYSRANGDLETTGFEEGLAIYSRFPLVNPTLNQLYSSGFPLITRRLALGATAKTPWGELFLVSTHLGHGRKMNARQFDRLHQWVEDTRVSHPAIIGGDFNIGEDSPQIRQAQRRWQDVFRIMNPDAKGMTFEISLPWGGPLMRSRLDYLFLRGDKRSWQVVESQIVPQTNSSYSDHLGVCARFIPSTRL